VHPANKDPPTTPFSLKNLASFTKMRDAFFHWFFLKGCAATPPEPARLLLFSGPDPKSYRNAASKDGIDQ